MDLGAKLLTGVVVILCLGLSYKAYGGDNHVHIDQVASGSVDMDITQTGYDNKIDFSFAHSGNDFTLTQEGNGNLISWVSYWGSGKSWGGDVDGTNNTETVSQTGGATYGRHIWGNSNTVDVEQNGDHTHNLDIHSSSVEHEILQSGSGSHYNHTYFYGSATASDTTISQTGTGNHNSQIRLQGTQPTTLNLSQDGSTNKQYTLTQNCYTSGGCTVNVSQSD
tara:strand:- start:501 stop:1166 length:666 start_codon:yes stop_codon:yes gene_type:complete